LQKQVDWLQAGLGRPHIMSQGLDIFGQGGGRQVMVVTRQDSGGNWSPVRVVVGLVAGVGWVRCRQWGGVVKSLMAVVFFTNGMEGNCWW